MPATWSQGAGVVEGVRRLGLGMNCPVHRPAGQPLFLF